MLDLRMALFLASALLGCLNGCNRDSDRDPAYQSREEYRNEEREKARRERQSAAALSFVPYVGGVGSSMLRNSAAEREAEANRDYMEQQMENEQRRRDAQTAAAVEAARRATQRADEEARIAQADREEANRDRSFPAAQLPPAARQIADKLIDELPRTDYVRHYVERTKSKLVLTSDLAVCKAKHTPPATVENLLAQVMMHLSNDPIIRDYFTVVADRTKANAIVLRSEGESERIILEANEAAEIVRYDPDMLVAVGITLYESDQRGSTTWNIHIESLNPKTRELLVQQEVRVP